MYPHQPAPPVPMVLVVVSGTAEGTRIVLDRPVLLGRDPRSRVPFDDERVSRHHALIDVVDGRPLLRDLGSKNGTFVNGVELREVHALRPKDRVRVGTTTMEVLEQTPLPIAAPPVPPEERIEAPTHFDHTAREQLQVNRRVLRRATDLTNRLADTCRSRHALASITGAIRREFHADGAGIFFLDPPFKPLYSEGDLTLGERVLHRLHQHLHRGPWTSAILVTDRSDDPWDRRASETVIAFPLHESDDVRSVFVIRRDPSRPFLEEDLQFAETLAECLRVLPLHEVLARDPAAFDDSLEAIIGSSELMKRLREQIRSYANTSATVLLMGESGTGKELCARALWQLSDRRFAPYLEVNSACIVPDLMESELFGHEKGAFTNANERTPGKLELADGGTLFLDEIGELPLDLQAKLLRVLEGQPFYRIGGRQLIHSNVRFICATNRDLAKMVEEGQFRADLYHRINILRLDLPPLRNRLEDVPELAEYLIEQIQAEFSNGLKYQLSPKAYRRLMSHHWPGNVRELRNVLQRMMLLSNSTVLDERMVPKEIGQQTESTTLKLPRLQLLTEAMEREEITRALMECDGQKSKAARQLGISRPTLDKKIKQYALTHLAKGREGEAEEE